MGVNTADLIRFELEGLSVSLPPHKRVLGFDVSMDPLPRTTTGKLKRHLVASQRVGSDPRMRRHDALNAPSPGSDAVVDPPHVARLAAAVQAPGKIGRRIYGALALLFAAGGAAPTKTGGLFDLDNDLITETVYEPTRGRVLETIDPKGQVTRYLYDDLDRQIAIVENAQEGDVELAWNDTDGHWPAMAELIAPLGHICTIVENAQPLDQNALKLKSAALHWEFMFTRSMFTTPDIAQQGRILQQVAQLLDDGKLSTTLSETLHGLSVDTLTAAHQQLLGGHMQGKLVIAY